MSRYIDADAVVAYICKLATEMSLGVMDMPTIDAVEVVRCRECVYYEPLDDTRPYDCPKGQCGVLNDDFCSCGERRE